MPAIHAFRILKDVDVRHKAGHDDSHYCRRVVPAPREVTVE